MPELLESLNNLYGPTAGQYLLNTNGASTQQQKPIAFLQYNLTQQTNSSQIVTTAGPNVYYLYGSSRMGEQKHFAGKSNAQTYHQQHGSLTYEFTDHLGNVKLTTNNRLKLHYRNTAYHLEPTLLSSVDYYPFGMQMPGRQFSSNSYRYGFQGQERDDEIRGAGNSLNYKYRMADVRLGRFFAIDPLFKDYPHNSTYAFSENRVIDGIELEGLEYFPIHGVLSKPKKFGTEKMLEFNTYMRKYVSNSKGYDAGFAWNKTRKGKNFGLHKMNGLMFNDKDAKNAGELLGKYVVDNRDPGDEITLAGFSGGALVALVAANYIYQKTGEKVNLIMVNPPAMKDPESELHPNCDDGINDALILHTEGDFVPGLKGGAAKNFDSKKPVNPNFQLVKMQSTKKGIGAHMVNNINMESVKKSGIERLDPVSNKSSNPKE